VDKIFTVFGYNAQWVFEPQTLLLLTPLQSDGIFWRNHCVIYVKC